MITDLWIENFKGIGKRQHIPLSPITLLFGTNSAGKSTVLHALLYLKEILVNGNCDPTHQLDGENTISFGGFNTLVHKTNEKSADSINLTARLALTARQRYEWIHSDERRQLEEIRATNFQNAPQWARDLYEPGIGVFSVFEFEESHPQLYEHAPVSLSFSLSVSHRSAVFAPFAPLGEFTVNRVAMEANDLPFFTAYLFPRSFGSHDDEDKQLCGYVNLLSPCWKHRVNGIEVASHDQGTSEVRSDEWIEYEEQSSRLERMCQPANYFEGTTGLITRVFEVPRYFRFPSDKEKKQSLLDCVTSEDLLQVRLPNFLAAIRPIELSEEELEWIDEPAYPSVMVLLIRNPLHSSESEVDRYIWRQPFRLVGLWFEERTEFDDSYKIINCIRSYVFDRDSIDLPSRGKWVCAVTLEANATGLPDLNGEEEFCSTHDEDSYRRRAPDEGENARRAFIKHRLAVPPINAASHQFDDDVERIIRKPVEWLRTSLDKNLIYVGPKRSTVTRNLTKDNCHLLTTWGNGLAAWSWILKENKNLNIVSSHLAAEDWLNTGYEIKLKKIIQCPSSHWLDQDDVTIDFGKFQLGTEGPIPFNQLTPEQYDVLVRKMAQLQTELENANKLSHFPKFTRAYLEKRCGASELHPQDVGEGITQIIPVLVALQHAKLVLLEQPELHLHPSVAARIADVLLDARISGKELERSEFEAFDWNSSDADPKWPTLIETHSEHLILRLLRRIRQTTDNELPEHIPPVKPDDVCVLWVENLGDGTTFQRLQIDERGEFIDRWPRGFFSERAQELF